MGKKRDLANKNIERLIDEYVDTVERYNTANCIYEIHILGCNEQAKCMHNCGTCKEFFYERQKENLRDMFIVK